MCIPGPSCLGCPGALWNNPANIFMSDGNMSFAVHQNNPMCFQQQCFYSQYLYGSNFGFSIPMNATILGIVAEVERNPGNPNAIADSSVRLFLGMSMVGANYASPTLWPNGYMYASYGGATDLWSSSWTPADINDPTFGLYFRSYNSSANLIATVAVNHMRMTVYYSVPTGVFSQTGSPSGLQAGFDPASGKPWFSVISLAEQQVNASVLDVTGKLLFRHDALNLNAGLSKHELNISSLTPGIYFLRIESTSGIRTKKFVVN